MAEWLTSANNLTNTGQTFKLINYFVGQREAADLVNLDRLHNLSKKSETESWDDFKSCAQTVGELSPSQQKQYRKTCQWISKCLKFEQEKFSLTEFKRAVK